MNIGRRPYPWGPSGVYPSLLMTVGSTSGVAPTPAHPGDTVTVTGTNMGGVAGSVRVNGQVATVTVWTPTAVSFLVPTQASYPDIHPVSLTCSSGAVLTTAQTLTTLGPTGQAAGFDHTLTQYLDVSSNSTLQVGATDDLFVCMWFYPTLLPGFYKRLLCKSGGASDEWFLHINPTGNVIEFGYHNGTTYQLIDGGAVTLNAWNFVYADYNHTNGALQITQSDYAHIAFQAHTGPIAIGSNPVTLGSDAAHTGTQCFDGRIDAVGLGKTRLINTQVDAIYNSAAGIRSSALDAASLAKFVSWWELDDSGATWVDAIGGNNFTAHGGVTSVTGKT